MSLDEASKHEWPNRELTIGNGTEYLDVREDYVIIRPTKTPETATFRNGIHLVDPGGVDPQTGRPYVQRRGLVLAIGLGAWTDAVGADGKFMRRPPNAKVGDTVMVRGESWACVINGEPCVFIQNYQILGILLPAQALPVDAIDRSGLEKPLVTLA